MKLSLFLSSLLAVACVTSLSAAPKSPGFDDDSTPPPAAKPVTPVKRTFTSKGEVMSFTAFSLTLKGPKGQPDHVFAFTENTKIMNNDKSASLGDIKVGKSVGLLAKRIPKTEDQLLVVNVGSKLEVELDKPDPVTDSKKSTDSGKKSSSDNSNPPPKKKKKPASSND